jgi:hypothetical protein
MGGLNQISEHWLGEGLAVAAGRSLERIDVGFDLP